MLQRALPVIGPWLKPLMFRYWRLRRGITLGVRVALFDDSNRICLVRHTYAPGWHFPGGGVEITQTARQAALAELRQEAHIDWQGDLELFAIYKNPKDNLRDHICLYTARGWCGGHNPVPDMEIAECRFFSLSGLPAQTTASTRARLDEIAGRSPPAEIW